MAGGSFVLTFIAVVAAGGLPVAAPPLGQLLDQEPGADRRSEGSPIWPADPETFTYGKDLDVVPGARSTARRATLALVEAAASRASSSTRPDPRRRSSPGRARGGRSSPSGRLDPHLENFTNVWDLIDYPRLLFNTIVIAIIGMIGTVVSCTLVAYGFARFRFPGRNMLFLLVIATIFLPGAVTIIPTYTILRRRSAGSGTWLPLLVPTFFANAYDVFLMRQYLMTIPREMDEAAAIDGAGPFRTLISVHPPAGLAVIIAVAIFHLVYSWNDFFGPLIYLSGTPDLQPWPSAWQRFNGIHTASRALIPGRHAHDPDHPGRRVPHLPARLHPRHRHHRRREVTAVPGSPFRVALTFDVEHPDRPATADATETLLGR